MTRHSPPTLGTPGDKDLGAYPIDGAPPHTLEFYSSALNGNRGESLPTVIQNRCNASTEERTEKKHTKQTRSAAGGKTRLGKPPLAATPHDGVPTRPTGMEARQESMAQSTTSGVPFRTPPLPSPSTPAALVSDSGRAHAGPAHPTEPAA